MYSPRQQRVFKTQVRQFIDLMTRAKQLSMSSTSQMIWLCACVRYWPGRGLVQVCPLHLSCLDLPQSCLNYHDDYYYCMPSFSTWNMLPAQQNRACLPGVINYYHHCLEHRSKQRRKEIRGSDCTCSSISLTSTTIWLEGWMPYS